MYVVFQSVYTWAGPFMDLIEGGTGALQNIASDALTGTPMLQSLIADGIIGGVGAFVVFLPQILVLFLFISLLEESGYMARAAFLMDKLFHWCGLNGKSFVPLLSSYACAIPGILATRTISDPKARMITILIAPLMSCSARLPVYLLLIGAFVEPRYGPAVDIVCHALRRRDPRRADRVVTQSNTQSRPTAKTIPDGVAALSCTALQDDDLAHV